MFKSIIKLFTFYFLTVSINQLSAQIVSQVFPATHLLHTKWNAKWIIGSESSTYDYGVCHFRKIVKLQNVPNSFIINVSGDQRYEFFVNGQRILRGPATGDLLHWYYETIDIAPFLKSGENLLSATVWHYGIWTPGAQISMQLGFIVQGNNPAEEIANTNSTWKSIDDTSYSPSTNYMQDVGPGDVINGNTYPWGWNDIDYNDEKWKAATENANGTPQLSSTEYRRALTPRDIPFMENELKTLTSVRRSNIEIPPKFLNGTQPILIEPNKNIILLLDQSYLINAYPIFTFSKGKGSKVTVKYAEGMFLNNFDKGNRNEIEGKHIIGKTDSFYIDGGENRKFSTLWFRTYRYMEVAIQTANEPLVFESVVGESTGYPFKENAVFVSNDTALTKIWKTAWRTARLCAGDTYYDCPYYEQLQYTGDTRIQALISLYVSGDDRLMRKAINNLSWSCTSDGILKSRYPARFDQIIPPFSLYWINMLHDYWMLRPDKDFVGSHLATVKSIINWYAQKIDPKTGMLGAMPHWNFTDWPKEWPWNDSKPLGGVAAGALDGGSSILSLQLAYSLGDAIDLMTTFENKCEASRYKEMRESINQAVKFYCFNTDKKLFADDITRTSYSQHASIMGILSGALSKQDEVESFKQLIADKSLIQATVYYKFYLFRAMKKAGMSNEYLKFIGVWKDMISNGLTTFAEKPEPSRSDCHAWSASPIYDFLSTVCGIESASPGFKTVRIAPALGVLTEVKGAVPHPNGKILVELKKVENRLQGVVTLPAGLSGIFVYGNKTLRLNSGENKIITLYAIH